MRHFVQGDEAGEGAAVDELAEPALEHDVADGPDDLVELRFHQVLVHLLLAALLFRHARVVRQRGRDGLDAGLVVAAEVHDVDHFEHIARSGGRALVLLLDGKFALEGVDVLLEHLQFLRPGGVLHHDGALEGGFVVEETVFVVLDRTDDHVDGIVLEIHPRHVALVIVIRGDGFRPQGEIVFQRRVVGQRGGFLEQRGDAGGLRIVLVIGHGAEFPVLPHDDGVGTLERLLLGRIRLYEILELLPGHVRGIESGPGGLARGALAHEALAFEDAVIRTVVDHDVGEQVFHPLSGRGEGVAHRDGVMGGLLPEDLVHQASRLDELGHEGLLAVGERFQVHGNVHVGEHRHALRHGFRCCRLLHGFFLLLLAAARQQHHGRRKRGNDHTGTRLHVNLVWVNQADQSGKCTMRGRKNHEGTKTPAKTRRIFCLTGIDEFGKTPCTGSTRRCPVEKIILRVLLRAFVSLRFLPR